MATDEFRKGISNAIDSVPVHLKMSFIISGVLIIGGTIVGTVGYAVCHSQRKLYKQFQLALQEYLTAAHDGSLSIDVLNNLLSSIEAIEKSRPKETTNVNISSDQFNDLPNYIFDFTKRLAEVNNINISSINVNAP